MPIALPDLSVRPNYWLLNHANIATLYGMELVEGETLAERIARAPMPLEESLKIAHQIAEALEAAHEKGVIHRGLCPISSGAIATQDCSRSGRPWSRMCITRR